MIQLFSKYDVYTTTQSLYCYKDTKILKNKLNIKNADLLKLAEEEITAVKQFELQLHPINGYFTKTHLLNIHRFIFEDIYPFAGRIRREQIRKGDTVFYPPELINRELNRVFAEMKSKNIFKEKDYNNLLDSLAYFMAELNIIHPFREGNGRTIREFMRLLAEKCGYNLNWSNVDREELLEASILSVDDYKKLIDVLKKCIT